MCGESGRRRAYGSKNMFDREGKDAGADIVGNGNSIKTGLP